MILFLQRNFNYYVAYVSLTNRAETILRLSYLHLQNLENKSNARL